MSGLILLILRALLAASLYAFVGLAFFLLWRDLYQQARPAASRLPPTLTLKRIDGLEAAHLRFTVSEIVIGRDPSCDCVLEDNAVSAKHARLSYRKGQWWVEDMRSTNGTYLNQEPVTAPLVITNGDELRCGQAILAISVGDTL